MKTTWTPRAQTPVNNTASSPFGESDCARVTRQALPCDGFDSLCLLGVVLFFLSSCLVCVEGFLKLNYSRWGSDGLLPDPPSPKLL